MTAAQGTGPDTAGAAGRSLIDAVERRALQEQCHELRLALLTAERDGRDRAAQLQSELIAARRQLLVAQCAMRSLRLHPGADGGVVLTPAGDGETWVLDVITPAAGLLDLALVDELPRGWKRAASEHAENGTALVGEAGAQPLQVGAGSAGALVRLLRHPWSGTTELVASCVREVVELRAERTGSVELLCSADGIRPPH